MNDTNTFSRNFAEVDLLGTTNKSWGITGLSNVAYIRPVELNPL